MWWKKKKKKKEFDCCSNPQLKGVDPNDRLGWCTFQCQSCKACWDMDFGGWSRDTTAENMLALDHSFPLFTKDFNWCTNCGLGLNEYPAKPCGNRTGNDQTKKRLILQRRYDEVEAEILGLQQEKKGISDKLSC